MPKGRVWGGKIAKIYDYKKIRTLGATIEGIDLKVPDDKLVKILKDALDNNLVIKIKNQKLDRFGLAKLVKKFGPPYIHPIVPNGYDDCPEVWSC